MRKAARTAAIAAETVPRAVKAAAAVTEGAATADPGVKAVAVVVVVAAAEIAATAGRDATNASRARHAIIKIHRRGHFSDHVFFLYDAPRTN